MKTSALDRLEAAIGDDGPIPRELQLDLVRDLLDRGRVTGLTANLPSPTLIEQAAWMCRNCLREWPLGDICGECGQSFHSPTKEER